MELQKFRIKMKEYKVIPQEKDTFCICSVLQAILYKDNIYVSQEDIAQKLNPSEKGFYVDDEKITIFLKRFEYEYNYYARNKTPFNEPSLILKEIYENEGFVGVNNHIYLLAEFNDPELILIDPLDASKKEKDYYKLIEEMVNLGDGLFGLIKKLD